MAGNAPKIKSEGHNRNWAPPLQELHNAPPVQTKLEIGEPGDKYEQEADKMADQVMMPPYDRSKMVMMAPNPDNPTLQMKPLPKKNTVMMAGNPDNPTLKTRPRIQKNEMSESENEEDKVQMQTKPAIQQTSDGSSHASPELATRISSTKGQGKPLPENTQNELGGKMSASFSNVKIHTDSQAIQMNNELGAKAFTHGGNIYFNKGNYNPDSSEGRHLLAHELTHTIQQGDSKKMINKQGPPTGATNYRFDTFSITKESLDDPEIIARLNQLSIPQLEQYREKVADFEVQQYITDLIVQKGAPSPEEATVGETSGEGTTVEESPVEIGGDPDGKKTLLVAWTMDDGPKGKITEKMQTQGLGGLKAATWYIQYSKLTGDWDTRIAALKKIQDEGGEIAIHSFMPNSRDDHHTWFPINPTVSEKSAYSYPFATGYTETGIMDKLQIFYDKLVAEKINPKFVRLPGGLVSELSHYATNERVSTKIASKIIKGTDVSSYGPKAVKIANDFETLKAKLSAMDLLLWGGTANWLDLDTRAGAISSQSWNAESSGVGARTDNVTLEVSPGRKATGKNDPKYVIFDRVIKSMNDGDVRGMVILAHDATDGLTSKGEANPNRDDVSAVAADKKYMEDMAAKDGVNIRIEYVTMSDLFTRITGEDIATYDVKY